ncbi:unnamed protein product [Rotaria magnacalcarata]|uniref:Uncharacterized protein n=1 Tax=Rotaria magnacalcarata TaxID=392030 RepID=A0A815KHV4_9BILA|nr:unnamed protein product [Rotaria magnacalcarata]
MIGNTTVGSDIDSSTRNPTGFCRMTSISYNAGGITDLQEQLVNSSSTIDPTFLVANKLLSIEQVHQNESAETNSQ